MQRTYEIRSFGYQWLAIIQRNCQNVAEKVFDDYKQAEVWARNRQISMRLLEKNRW